MAEEIQPPVLRAKDKRGNVRPADDRFLSGAQKAKRDAHVEKVAKAVERSEAKEAAKAAKVAAKDPYAEVLTNAVEGALTAPDQAPAPEVAQQQLPADVKEDNA